VLDAYPQGVEKREKKAKNSACEVDTRNGVGNVAAGRGRKTAAGGITSRCLKGAKSDRCEGSAVEVLE